MLALSKFELLAARRGEKEVSTTVGVASLTGSDTVGTPGTVVHNV
jgi:hypothetical protein